jgi:hypothetical protein
MRRKILLVVLVALWVVALMVPAFAQNGAEVGSADCDQKGPDQFDSSGTGVVTPSGNINVQCNAHEPGNNAGGSSGGPAFVADDEDLEGGPPVFFETGGTTFTTAGGGEDLEAHGVETPSGNVNIQGHLHPEGPKTK